MNFTYLKDVFHEIEIATEASKNVIDVTENEAEIGDTYYFRKIEHINIWLVLKISQLDEQFLFLRYILDCLCQWINARVWETSANIDAIKFYDEFENLYTSEDAANRIVRSAAENMIETAGKTLGINFEAVDSLSLTMYEKHSEPCTILFAEELSAKSSLAAFLNYVPKDSPEFRLEKIREIRKLAAGGNGRRGLVFECFPKDCPKFAGFQQVCQPKMEKEYQGDIKPFLATILTKGALEWDLFLFGCKVLCRRKLRYIVPNDPIKKCMDTIQCDFRNAAKMDLDKLRKRIAQISQQEHGASIVVAEDYSKGYLGKRVSRLVQHEKASPIKVCNPSEMDDFYKGLAAIDGAVLVQLDGTIKYIGVILDGVSCIKGKRERGSRYNSMNNFVNEMIDHGESVVGIVCSEDGGMNVLPETEKNKPTRKIRSPYII